MRAGESRLYFLNLTPLNYKIILSGRTPTLLRTSEMCLNRLTLRAACREFAAVASSTTTTLSGPCSLLNTSVIARCICKDKQANQSKLTCPRHTHIPAATPPPPYHPTTFLPRIVPSVPHLSSAWTAFRATTIYVATSTIARCICTLRAYT